MKKKDDANNHHKFFGKNKINKSSFFAIENKQIFDNITTALYTGIPAMYLGYPFKSIEKRVQMDKSISINPKILYRGSGAYVGTFSLTTMIQYGINAGLFGGKINASGSSNTTFTQAAISGWLSGFFSVHAENIIVRQHAKGLGLFPAISSLLKESPTRTFRSLSLICAREAIYCPTNLLFVDQVGKYIEEKNGGWGFSIVGQILASLASATISHPFECMATKMQKLEKSTSIINISKEIHATEGISGFFKGFIGRAGLFCVVTPFMIAIRGPLSEQIKNGNYNPFSCLYKSFFCRKTDKNIINHDEQKSNKYDNGRK